MHFTFVSHFFAPLPCDACHDSKYRRWEYCWGTETLNQLRKEHLIQYVWQNYETLLSCMIRAFILFWVGSSERLFSSPASSLRSLHPELCPAALLRGGSGGKCRLLKWNGSTLNLLPGSSPSNSREGASERERGEKQSPPEAWWD